MSKRFDVRIPDEMILEVLNKFIESKKEENEYITGKWVQKILKIGLMVCGCKELQNDQESISILNSFINSESYTRAKGICMIKAIDTTPRSINSKGSKLTTKKDRAYYVLNYLKSTNLEEFTFRDYLDKSKELLERANDERTIASNIELLEKDGAIAWVYERYSYDEVLDEIGEIDPNKRKLTPQQRLKFTYNTQLIKNNPFYIEDKSIKEFTASLKNFIERDHNDGVTDSHIDEFADVNGIERKKVWVAINILLLEGFLNLMQTGKQGINIYNVKLRQEI